MLRNYTHLLGGVNDLLFVTDYIYPVLKGRADGFCQVFKYRLYMYTPLYTAAFVFFAALLCVAGRCAAATTEDLVRKEVSCLVGYCTTPLGCPSYLMHTYC